VQPFPWKGYNPSGFLAYDEQGFSVYQRIIHGRPLTIAWEKKVTVPESTRSDISQFYFDTFIKWWEIFKGFPYSSYTVVLKTESKFAGGEQGIGYEGIATNYASQYGERVAHEVFHAWVGNALRDDNEKKFDDGLWFREGITQYYGDRGAGVRDYGNLMKDHWRIYQTQILGTQYDIPLTDMPAKGKELGEDPAGNNRRYRLNVYWKGALVAYMMDQRLTARGLNLDVFLKYLYDNYALKQTSFTTQDTIRALNVVSGEDWNDFFREYIYGTTKLPLDGKFDYLPH
jgi:predicted metalloprotease with PDZ domain